MRMTTVKDEDKDDDGDDDDEDDDEDDRGMISLLTERSS